MAVIAYRNWSSVQPQVFSILESPPLYLGSSGPEIIIEKGKPEKNLLAQF